MAQLVKTVQGLAIASVKTVDNLAIASVKTVMGLDNTASGANVAFDATFEKGATGQATPFAYVSNAGTVAGSVGANSNRVLIACVSFFGATVDTGIGTVTATWNGVSMTQINTAGIAGVLKDFIFGLINPATGAQTISVGWDGGNSYDITVGCGSFYNANQTTAWQNFNSATATSTTPSLDITSTSGNMACGMRHDANATSAVIGNGTQMWDERSFDGNMGGSYRASTGATTNLSWTIGSSVQWLMCGVDVIKV